MIVFLIFTFLLEIGIFPGFFPNIPTPEFFIPIIVTASLLKSRKHGMIIALIFGILLDTFYLRGFGIRTVLFLSIGYFLGTYRDNFSKQSIFVNLIMTLASSVYYMIVYFLLINLTVGGVGLNSVIKSIFSLQIPILMVYSLLSHYIFRMKEKRR